MTVALERNECTRVQRLSRPGCRRLVFGAAAHRTASGGRRRGARADDCGDHTRQGCGQWADVREDEETDGIGKTLRHHDVRERRRDLVIARKGSVLATKAVETQYKGDVMS